MDTSGDLLPQSQHHQWEAIRLHGVFESKQSYTTYPSNTTEIWSRSGHFCCFIVNNVILMRSGFNPIAFGPSVNTCDNTTVPDKRKWSD